LRDPGTTILLAITRYTYSNLPQVLSILCEW
jgi:hypothetical protein